jgi:formylglycine-generating enzyme required for sulfatase activity
MLTYAALVALALAGAQGAFAQEGPRRWAVLDACRNIDPNLAENRTFETTRYVRDKFKVVQRTRLKGNLTPDLLDDRLGAAARLPEKLTNSIGMPLTLIPAGEFMMGSRESAEATAEFGRRTGFKEAKAESYTDEHPQHRVRITKPFYLGTYEVTKGQFAKFVSATGHKTEAETDGKGGYGYTGDDEGPFAQDAKFTWKAWGVNQSDDSPVGNVTWNDAAAFCEWLSGKEERKYRLPTEAEWEYACRAGTQTRFWNGDDAEGLAQIGNVADATAKAKWSFFGAIESSDGYAFTAPVGRFKPNAFGLYDTHGNVFELCQDWYGSEYFANSPGDDPTGPPEGSTRVLRGGGWGHPPVYCRSANRTGVEPAFRHAGIGFRVVGAGP